MVQATTNFKYFINTFGCQMNFHDSDIIKSRLNEIGFSESTDANKTDIIILNTCCIRDSAEQKILSYIGKLKSYKIHNPNLIIAVCGCMPQQNGVADRLKSSFPFLDIIIGTHNLNELYGFLKKRITENKRSFEILTQENENFENITYIDGKAPVASINIMQGCNNFCTYCIVPYVRGKERSRPYIDIIKEIKLHTQNGCKEVMLLGQNVNSYCDGEVTFKTLLEKICQDTIIERIRYMTSHPKDFSDDLVNTISKLPKLCRNIHLPVQSGSSKILKLMNRRYSREDYLTLIKKIRDKLPDIALSTDFIVGFPGETEDDFNDTLSLMSEVKFDSAFTFVYSKRTGTAAAKMPGQVSKEVRKERIAKLIELQNQITEEINKKYIGRTEKVLIEGLSKRDKKILSGRTNSGKTVNFKGNKNEVGQFRNVLITESKKNTLFGVQI